MKSLMTWSGEMSLDALVQDFIDRNGLTLRTTHYKTHAAEIDPKYLAEAMRIWEEMGGPEGDIEIAVRGFKGMTRLWGKKMGDRISKDEPLYTRKRGEGRPFQDRFILRDRPLRASDIITIVIYNGGLETIYAGAALGPMPDAGKQNGDWANWKDHYLAFTQRELDEMEKMPGKLASSLAKRVANAYMNKTAASGNYGFTKAIQNDVDVALRKLEKKVNDLARFVESKHPEAGTYFSTRCQGSNCNASKALSGACVFNEQPKRVLNGPLGYKPACVKASHKAITDLILHAGDVAHTLYKKDRDHIPYLQTHAKKKRCPLARLLLENYPVEIL
jgi:hypothetical protein